MAAWEMTDLLAAARDGARNAFLTKPGGTRYGAAVVTGSGRIYAAGQYSSFNHSTNIHAEMGALAVATAAGDPDVRLLALVSTGCRDVAARPCGVCRQVIIEHARRIGRPIEVLMASWDGLVVERMNSDELLPLAWEARGAATPEPWAPPDPPSAEPLRFGDHVVIAPGILGLVWHPAWAGGRAWVKVKYVGEGKLPHSYSAWDAYQAELERLTLGDAAPWGDRLVLVDGARCPRLPMRPLAAAGVERLRPLLDVLEQAEIPAQDLRLTGSYASGLHDETSDVDIVIDANAAGIGRARACLAAALAARQNLVPPSHSSTWKRMVDSGIDPMALVRAARFTDTFDVIHGRGRVRASLVWTCGMPPPLAVNPLEVPSASVLCSGTVSRIECHAKPTRWELQLSNGGCALFETWHKDGMRLKEGDAVTAAGIRLTGDERHLQISPDRDFIRWDSMVGA